MISYLPWSHQVFSDCIATENDGLLPCVDLDLTAKCTKASCIYCDSKPTVGMPIVDELTMNNLLPFISSAVSHGLKWIYTCGLGEPLEDDKFFQLLELLKSNGARISLFTNGLLIDGSVAQRLHELGACLILKLDSFDATVFDRILGGKGRAKRIYQALDCLLEAGYGRECPVGTTDLALSIVPTQLNIETIDEVLRFAKSHNLFPSIGELECAGNAADTKAGPELQLTPAQLKRLRANTDALLWPDYRRSVCPAVFCGLHVDVTGNCVVDKRTGLNCKWFMMQEPDVLYLGNVLTDKVQTLLQRIRYYRQQAMNVNETITDLRATRFQFGGCGGDPCDIVEAYLQLRTVDAK
jgi:hypothetical protein